MTATSSPSVSPSTGDAAFTTCDRITVAKPMVKAIDRSMPPEMMTKVWPIASSRGATANTAIELRFVRLAMKET